MAKILNKTLVRRRQLSDRPRRRYDWDNWANGKAWLLKQGVDYDLTANVMSAAIHYAKHHGMTVITRVVAGGLEVQFFRPVKKKLRRRIK